MLLADSRTEDRTGRQDRLPKILQQCSDTEEHSEHDHCRGPPLYPALCMRSPTSRLLCRTCCARGQHWLIGSSGPLSDLTAPEAQRTDGCQGVAGGTGLSLIPTSSRSVALPACPGGSRWWLVGCQGVACRMEVELPACRMEVAVGWWCQLAGWRLPDWRWRPAGGGCRMVVPACRMEVAVGWRWLSDGGRRLAGLSDGSGLSVELPACRMPGGGRWHRSPTCPPVLDSYELTVVRRDRRRAWGSRPTGIKVTDLYS